MNIMRSWLSARQVPKTERKTPMRDSVLVSVVVADNPVAR